MSFPVKPTAPLEAARSFIDKISKPACIIVAISGGSDSTGLLIALHQALRDADRHDISLEAVTIDHALRPESAEEAKGVAALCARIGVPHHLRRWNAPKPAAGLSAAARLARYALIGSVAAEIGADVIVVAHTLGDQQETIAMRGARSERQDNLGLAGMADAVLYDARHWIARPFLNSTRQGIRDFLSAQGRGWYDDPSNEDAKYERVRMRNLLAPAQESLSDRSINRLNLSSRAARLVEKNVQYHASSVIRIDAAGLSEEPAPLRYALSALASIVGGRRFAMAADSMDRVMDFAMKGEPGRVTAGRVMFDCRRDALYLMRENRDVPAVRIAAGEKAVWDRRFEITNRSNTAILVRGFGTSAMTGDTTAFAASVPSGVAKRAMQAMPVFESEEEEKRLLVSDVAAIRPLLAPYEIFLPRFDLELANVIADLFDRSAYPQPPI